jgi:choline transport protein
LNSWKQ